MPINKAFDDSVNVTTDEPTDAAPTVVVIVPAGPSPAAK